MIVDLCVRAGHPEPEFLEQGGAVGVRFVQSRYLAPHRAVPGLTERQKEILQILSHGDQLSFAEVRQALREAPSDRSIRNDLMHLNRLGIVRLEGRGRGARWSLEKSKQE
jgi:ATP-dependent DNA helicase RecG